MTGTTRWSAPEELAALVGGGWDWDLAPVREKYHALEYWVGGTELDWNHGFYVQLHAPDWSPMDGERGCVQSMSVVHTSDVGRCWLAEEVFPGLLTDDDGNWIPPSPETIGQVLALLHEVLP